MNVSQVFLGVAYIHTNLVYSCTTSDVGYKKAKVEKIYDVNDIA